MLPGTGYFFCGNGGFVRQAGIALRERDRPQVGQVIRRSGAPHDTTHVTHHHGIRRIASGRIRQSRLRRIEPVASALLLENGAMGDAYPSEAFAELVRMSHYRIAVTACIGKVASRDIGIRPLDLLTANNAGIVRDIQSVISHEQIVVSVLVDDLRSLAPLPAGGVAGTYPYTETLGQVRDAAGPGIAQVIDRHTRGRIKLQQREAAVPGAVDEIMLPFRYDIRRVDGIVIEISVIPFVGSSSCPAILTLVGGRACHEPVVGPVARLRRSGLGHADERTLGPTAVECLGSLLAGLDVIVNDYAIVHPKFLYTTYIDSADDRGPESV